MATIKIVLRKDKMSKKTNKAPLYIRITQNRKSKFISLGIKIEPKYWNEDKSLIKKGAINYKEINAYILQKRAEIERTSLDLDSRLTGVTSEKIKDKIKRKEILDFFSYSEKKLEELKTGLTYSTYSEYKVRLGKFKKFCEGKKLYFDEVNLDLLYKYDKYQYEVLKNKPYTVINNIKLIKTMVNYALFDNIEGADISIFKKHKIKKVQSKIKYLTEEQLKQVIEYDRINLKKPVYLDMFIFGCYSGGLRFSDIIDLKWNNYFEEDCKIVKLIKKTKRTHKIKLPNTANEIILKYKTEGTSQDDYIFPALKYIAEEKITEKIRNNRIREHNHYANTLLKIVAKDIDLPFNLTFHTSRHTFATIALKKGMRIEYVSKILDHSNISTTQIYAKVIDKELDKAMEIMNDL